MTAPHKPNEQTYLLRRLLAGQGSKTPFWKHC